MSEIQMALTAQEAEFLAELLNNLLKKTLVEEHRTRTPIFRESVIQREQLITSLLSKLGHTGAPV